MFQVNDPEDYPLYPPFATREVLANSICHRDYTTPGGAVTMAMYDDRLEIINPGTLHFDITRKTSQTCVNLEPCECHYCGILPGQYNEKWGMGTLNIIDWCKGNGNPEPTWIVRDQSVIASLFTISFLPLLG